MVIYFYIEGGKVMIATHIIRKYLVVGIILLFVGTCIIPSAISEQTHGKKIITVDDEPGDADYTSIKEAVNHSTPGTIIEIYSGTYDEQKIMIMVHNLTLKGIPHELGNGNDTGKPVIESSQLNASILLFINADSFSLLGCILIGSPWVSSDIYAESALHMVLSNNDIFHHHSDGYSVHLLSCDYPQILNNTVTTSDNGSSSGFWIFYCDYALVQNNTLRNSLGIYVFYSRHCSILSNQVTNTTADAGIQVEDDEDVSANDTISQNTVTNCSQTGISVNAVNISVMHNHVSNCQTGMEIDTGNSRIENNTIERCHFGLNLSCGLGDNNILTSNQVRNNSIGVILHQVGHKIIQVTRNNFIHNLVQVVVTAVVPVFSNYVFRENYWNHSLSHPKPVICLGLIIIWFPPLGLFIGIPLPWVCFDLTPAQHPYEIP